jgi:hypothetical protein
MDVTSVAFDPLYSVVPYAAAATARVGGFAVVELGGQHGGNIILLLLKGGSLAEVHST